MKRFSAQYVITNSGPALKKGIITADDDGTIISVEDTSGILKEEAATEFYNGIIIPGFVNCHCHLELSDLKGKLCRGQGLADFIRNIREQRDCNPEKKISSAIHSDDELYREGIVLCADICNTAVTFGIKKESRVAYINLLEVFGIDPGKAEKRLHEITQLSVKAQSDGIESWLVPHSAYSLSLSLFRLLKQKCDSNKVTSMHFMESSAEMRFLEDQSGPIKESYEESGLGTKGLETVKNHISAVLDEITPSGNLILVHNIYADRDTVRKIKARKDLFWCLCPGSNLYIENQLPPVYLLAEEGCELVIGTDSPASNPKLSILEELKIIHKHFPGLPVGDLISWATINGARALSREKRYGSIETGKRPGLLLLEDADLINMKLTPETRVKRLL